jgi:WD repeat-containing protein 6
MVQLKLIKDRSCRYWDIEKETIELILYGHTARIWDCIISKNYIITCGEDTQVRVCNKKGELVKKFQGHIGKNV